MAENSCIINVSSFASFDGWAGEAAFAAGCGGVNALTRPLALELAEQQIRVNTISLNWLNQPNFILRELHHFIQREQNRTHPPNQNEQNVNFDYTKDLEGFNTAPDVVFKKSSRHSKFMATQTQVVKLLDHVIQNKYLNGEVITTTRVQQMVL